MLLLSNRLNLGLKMDRILLFIPMYNCANQIVRVLSSLDENVQKYLTEVIVVNNLSTELWVRWFSQDCFWLCNKK